MRVSRYACFCLLVATVALSLPASALPVRVSSENGTSDNIERWTLFGRTVPITLTSNGIVVNATRQVICPQQDRTEGGCASGNYMFLFQLQSTSTNIPITIGKLQGFTPVGGNGTGTYGVIVCDDANNDLELCTEDPNDPNYTNFSGMTFTQVNKHTVKFTIPSIPNFPPGIQPQEGQGLTLFIVTQQSQSLPIAYPNIGD